MNGRIGLMYVYCYFTAFPDYSIPPTPMPDDTMFEFEQDMSRADVATYLRTVADKLDENGEVDFSAADQSTTVQVPEHVEFEIDLERESNDRGSSEVSLELEIEWYETREGSIAGPGSLEIG